MATQAPNVCVSNTRSPHRPVSWRRGNPTAPSSSASRWPPVPSWASSPASCMGPCSPQRNMGRSRPRMG